MTSERTDHEPDDELEEEKEAQVLQREALETELMDEDESEAGERISGVEDEPG